MDKVVLVNAFMRELDRRGDTTNLGEIKLFLKDKADLSDLVNHVATILGDALPQEDYDKVVDQTKKQIEEIAKQKMQDLNTPDLMQAVKVIEGTAKSMGIAVEG